IDRADDRDESEDIRSDEPRENDEPERANDLGDDLAADGDASPARTRGSQVGHRSVAQLAPTMTAAPTVLWVLSSIRMNAPVSRFFTYSSTMMGVVVRSRIRPMAFMASVSTAWSRWRVLTLSS